MKKEQFRQVQKNLLKKRLHFSFRQNFKVFKECFFLAKKFKAKNILLYTALNYEPNLLLFRRKFSKKHKLFVPFMQDKSLKIVKFRLPLFKKNFGILEPNDSFVKAKIDLAIVPVIGIDRTFRRIGHGQGFYDRFFENFKQKPLVIFTQSFHALSKEKFTQKHDILGEFYISPYRKYHRKEYKNDNNYCTYRRYNRLRNRIFACQKNERS